MWFDHALYLSEEQTFLLDSSAQQSVGVHARSQTQMYLSVMVINIGTIYHISFGSSESSYERVKARYIF